MTQYVVDASVVVKWFAPEIHSNIAGRLSASPHALVAPDFLPVEVANSFWKHVRRGHATRIEALERLAIVDRRVMLFPSLPLVESAINIALDHERTVYDSLYLALAIEQQCQLVTADRRLYNALSPTLTETVIWIEDIPPLG